MGRRKFPDIWYEHGRNPFPLKEYWYQEYALKHFGELGFSSIEGPLKSGPDFKGEFKGSSVTVEVERDYLAYRQHGHENFDVLIVGVVDPPHADMIEHLPPIIINVDPQVVMDWSEPFRKVYREEMDKRRALLPQQLERVRANLDHIKAFRIKKETVEYVPRGSVRCKCGGMMLESKHNTDLDGDLTDGQLVDELIGFWRILECKDCGTREWVQCDEVRDQFD